CRRTSIATLVPYPTLFRSVLAEELGAVTREDIPSALMRYVSRRSKHAGMVQDASLQNMSFYHLPDGPEQEERDKKLASFEGESRSEEHTSELQSRFDLVCR